MKKPIEMIKEELEWFEYAKKMNAHMRNFFVVRDRIKNLNERLKKLKEKSK